MVDYTGDTASKSESPLVLKSAFIAVDSENRETSVSYIGNRVEKEAAIAANYIGSELFRLTHYTEALKFHREELSYNEMIPDELGIAIANRKLGECYTELGQYEKALSHIKIFLDITASLKNKIENQRAWATLGRTFYLKYVQEQETNENNNSCNETLNKKQSNLI
ncbi:hypothetical protein CEXT_462221 [Caerostris extrusa]|uniref:Tetratricopeptide repeat protein n=1 Tax=Caerostris extrusa TaxID=172846 RepID=A0AAV4P894_CAEEX|nr:hypothetical protein CEXT_462221 [Caerostris extrusa]